MPIHTNTNGPLLKAAQQTRSGHVDEGSQLRGSLQHPQSREISDPLRCTLSSISALAAS